MTEQQDQSSPSINVRGSDGIGVIELAKPKQFNCLSLSMFRQIDDALSRFESDGTTRAIVISALGKNFCTGAELREVEAVRQNPEQLRHFLELGHRVLRRIEESPLPVIAAVQGLCLAGGLELVMACDVVFAAEDARFGDQHAAFGLLPGWGNSQRLPRAIGLQRALDLMFSARWIDAGTAQAWGLASYLVPAAELTDQATKYASTLCTRSRAGIAAMKRLSRQGLDRSLEDALAGEVEVALQTLPGKDATEGLTAFKEKRAPRF
jgi:enoyl-CoA hydratase